MNKRQKRNLQELNAGKGILVIQTAFLGDVILVTPLLRAIKQVFPLSPLTALVLPQWKEVVEGWCDDVIPFDKHHAGKSDWAELILTLKSKHYGAAFIPHRSPRSGWIAKAAEIPVRVGFDRGAGRFFFTDTVAYERSVYEGMRNLGLLSPFFDVDFDPLPEIPTDSVNMKSWGTKLGGVDVLKDRFVVFAPASVWKTKEWPIEHYRQLAEELKSRFGLMSLAVGGRDDVQPCSAAILDENFNLAGRLSILESVALMKTAKLVISGDSAAAHLATAARTRQAIIFGSTTPRFGFAPPSRLARIFGLDLYCRPCTDHGRKKCPIHLSALCLDSVSPGMVINAVTDWLETDNDSVVVSVDKGR